MGEDEIQPTSDPWGALQSFLSTEADPDFLSRLSTPPHKKLPQKALTSHRSWGGIFRIWIFRLLKEEIRVKVLGDLGACVLAVSSPCTSFYPPNLLLTLINTKILVIFSLLLGIEPKGSFVHASQGLYHESNPNPLQWQPSRHTDLELGCLTSETKLSTLPEKIQNQIFWAQFPTASSFPTWFFLSQALENKAR
jgi:hypothetical protein